MTMTDNSSAAVAISARSKPASALFSLLLKSFRAHVLILMTPLLFLALSAYLTASVHDPQRVPVSDLVLAMLGVSLPAALVAMFFVRLFQYAVYLKPDSPSRQMLADIKYLLVTPNIYINALPAVMAMIIHNKAALELKASIPKINPFSWDQAFIDMDRAMHFGVDPWRLLQPVLGFPYVTFMLNNLYNFWFLLMFGMWFFFAFQRSHSQLRDRFFISFSMTWLIGGGVLAVVFSSAGPVYLADLGHTPNPFTALMAYLYDVNDNTIAIWALDAQRLLWDGYTDPDKTFMGISAFPSMHNACVTVFACAAWGLNRTFGKVVAFYAFCILLGSVHLGWHYAVDGYAGIALGLLVWWAAGYVVRWHEKQPWVVDYKQSLQ